MFNINVDLSKEEDIKSIADYIGVNYKVKYVVHSAGIIGVNKPLINQNYEEINYITKVNLIAPIFLNNQLIEKKKLLGTPTTSQKNSRLKIPPISLSDRSRIINLSSEAAHHPIL
jgi:NAD(P)-dependent dehydrogenase (short-subunit alcohol dehydrogenase family)